MFWIFVALAAFFCAFGLCEWGARLFGRAGHDDHRGGWDRSRISRH